MIYGSEVVNKEIRIQIIIAGRYSHFAWLQYNLIKTLNDIYNKKLPQFPFEIISLQRILRAHYLI